MLPAAIERQKPSRVDPALVKALARSHAWFHDLAAGRAMSIEGIAAREGLTEGYVRRLIRLAFLAPDIVEAILDGRQPAELTAASLTRRIDLPLDWRQQAQCTGF